MQWPLGFQILKMDGTEGLKLPMWTLLLLTSSLLTPVNCQFQRAPEDSGCAPDTTCVLITECPRLLEILKQVHFFILLDNKQSDPCAMVLELT